MGPSAKIPTSEANESLFFSPPEIPRSRPGIPMYVSAHFVSPSYEETDFTVIHKKKYFNKLFTLSHFRCAIPEVSLPRHVQSAAF